MSDIIAVIEVVKRIDAKIKALEEAKKVILDVSRDSTPQRNLFVETIPISELSVKKPLTRREQVVKLIKIEGPQRRKDIIAKTGTPRGTLSFVLRDKETFISRNGKWHLAANY